MEFAGETSVDISVYRAFFWSKDAGLSRCEGVELLYGYSVQPPCGLLSSRHGNTTEGRWPLVHWDAGLGLTGSSVLPDHTSIHSGPRRFQHLRGWCLPSFKTCLCGFHFSTWCLDCKLQGMRVHLFSPRNKGGSRLTLSAEAPGVPRPQLSWQPTRA